MRFVRRTWSLICLYPHCGTRAALAYRKIETLAASSIVFKIRLYKTVELFDIDFSPAVGTHMSDNVVILGIEINGTFHDLSIGAYQ